MNIFDLQNLNVFYKKYIKDTNLKVMDYGSRIVSGPITPNIVFRDHQYQGFDIEPGKNVDVVIREDMSEFYGKYDVIISMNVLEHTKNPFEFMATLKKFGHVNTLIYVACPNTWAEHRYPIDCWRVYPDGMKELFNSNGIMFLEAYTFGSDTIGMITDFPTCNKQLTCGIGVIHA